MLRTLETTLEVNRRLHFREQIKLRGSHCVLVTRLDEPAVDEVLLFAEAALAKDWLRPEEDAARADLHPDR